jgi:hypothetical protein
LQDPEESKARAAATRLKNKEAEEQASLRLQYEAKGKDNLAAMIETTYWYGWAAPRGAKVAALKNAGERYFINI